MQHADDQDGGLREGVIDRVIVDEENAVALTHLIAANAQLGIVGQKADALVQLIEILVGLISIPLPVAVFPDTDQVEFREGGFMDFPSQA